MVKIPREQYVKDRELVMRELRENPSKQAKDIATELGFSVQKVYKILRESHSEPRKKKSIEHENDELRHFIILTKTAGNPYFSIMKINQKNDLLSEESLKDIGINLDFCYEANGEPDVIIGVSSKDVMQTKILCNMLENEFQSEIRKIDIIEILQPFNFPKSNAIRLP